MHYSGVTWAAVILLPASQRRALLATFAFDHTNLAARLISLRTWIARIEAELVILASLLPAYRLLLRIPEIGSTLTAILLAEISDIG